MIRKQIVFTLDAEDSVKKCPSVSCNYSLKMSLKNTKENYFIFLIKIHYKIN